jgi:hypothetical protein
MAVGLAKLALQSDELAPCVVICYSRSRGANFAGGMSVISVHSLAALGIGSLTATTAVAPGTQRSARVRTGILAVRD